MKHKPPPVRRHRSKGELISTFTFLGVGLFFAGETKVLLSEGQQHKAVLMGFFCVLCLAGAARFHIHNLWHLIQSKRR
jgi:hypothetical protein